MGQDKKVACYDLVNKEWLVYNSSKEANLIMGFNGSAAVAVAKIQKSIVQNRYFFCDYEDMPIYTEEVILDVEKRKNAKPKKSTCEKSIAIYDIRNANKGWVIHDSLKKAAKSIDMALSTLNNAVRDNELYKERYIIAYEGEHLKLDIPKILELPLEDNRYYIFPHTQEEREELYKRLQIGIKYHPKYNSVEKLKELALWSNEQAEEANDSMRRKIEEKMMERYNTTSTIVAGMKKKGDEDEIEGFEDIDDIEDIED
jgi:hypothetical protein